MKTFSVTVSSVMAGVTENVRMYSLWGITFMLLTLIVLAK